jgi:effector-binding domain-containing protein
MVGSRKDDCRDGCHCLPNRTILVTKHRHGPAPMPASLLRLPLALAALVAATCLSLAQTAPLPPPVTAQPLPPPAETPAQPTPPAAPAPATQAQPAAPPAPAPPDTASPPAAPVPPPTQAAPAEQPAAPFAREVMLKPRPMLFVRGTSTWDEAYEKLSAAFRTVATFIGKNGLQADGPPFVIYTSTDDTGFEYQAAFALKAEPKTRPRGEVQQGLSPAGKAIVFTHEGSYGDMDTLYEAIANYLDEKQFDARDMFIEEYLTDPATTPETELKVVIYVLLK